MLAPGERLLRHRMLGLEARYRLVAEHDCGPDGTVVELEVVEAPGLAPGTRIRVTAPAARRMTTEDGNSAMSGAPWRWWRRPPARGGQETAEPVLRLHG